MPVSTTMRALKDVEMRSLMIALISSQKSTPNMTVAMTMPRVSEVLLERLTMKKAERKETKLQSSCHDKNIAVS